MRLPGARALITGGAGGIGSALAAELLARGADVLLVGRDTARLAAAALALSSYRERVTTVAADLTLQADRERVASIAAHWHGGVNVLVNNAGINQFGLFERQSAGQLERVLLTNIHAPMLLTQAVLPVLLRQDQAAIVNIGSVYGAIGMTGNVAYSASKFALRGFSEALRRELADSTVRVHYYAPRATRTAINPAAVERMNVELGVTMDAPAVVAGALCRLLEHERRDAVLGWPEKLLVYINAVLPGAVDRALRKQLEVVRRHAGVPPIRALERVAESVTLIDQEGTST